jgi:hypothetical protein
MVDWVMTASMKGAWRALLRTALWVRSRSTVGVESATVVAWLVRIS